MTLTLTLPKGEFIFTGKQVTFESPCESEGLTGLIVDGVTYDLVSSMGTTLVANSFDAGAMVSVIFNLEKKKAFVQNADTNAHLDSELAKKYSPDNKPTAKDVGLGNVPNVSTNNQTPTYTVASSFSTLTSGEKLSTAFGKIAKAIQEFSSHFANSLNPHAVTKSQVGLGNVPNVSTNNQTPTFIEASENANLVSGEVLSTALGKIAKAIKSLISHLADTTSHITSSERTSWNSKAAGTHNHSASNITSGILAPERGGTGATGCLTNAGVNAIMKKASDGNTMWYVNTANGAMYAESANGMPKFGTLPAAQGGTGVTSLMGQNGLLGKLFPSQVAPQYIPVIGQSWNTSGFTTIAELSQVLGGEKVCDIKTTLRTDLGDKWALCNGTNLSKVAYPALLPFQDTPKSASYGVNSYERINTVAYHNGLFVAGGSYYKNTSNDRYPAIYYSTDGINWTQKKLLTTEYRSCNFGSIVYCDGTWVGVCRILIPNPTDDDSENTDYGIGIFYTNDPTGTWSFSKILTGSSTDVSMAYNNGTWVIVQGSYAHTSTALDGTWAKISTSMGTARKIIFADNKWVICGSKSSKPTVCATSTNSPTSTWTAYTVAESTSSSSSGTNVLYDIAYHDGTWVTVGYYWTSDSSKNYSYIYHTTNLAGTWGVYHVKDKYNYISTIDYHESQWIAFGEHQTSGSGAYLLRKYTSVNPNDGWVYDDFGQSITGVLAKDAYFYGDLWFITSDNAFIKTNALYTLPTITTDGAYNYMKVKE